MSKLVEAKETLYKDVECFLEALFTVELQRQKRPINVEEVEIHLEPGQEKLAERLREKYKGLNVKTNGAAKLRDYMRETNHKANVVIRKGKNKLNLMDDVGWFIDEKGDSKVFISHYDDRDGKFTKGEGGWQAQAKQEYGVAVAKKTCAVKGWRVKERRENGNVKLSVTGFRS